MAKKGSLENRIDRTIWGMFKDLLKLPYYLIKGVVILAKLILITVVGMVRDLVKLPYYLIKGASSATKITHRKIEERKVEKKRDSIKPVYQDFKIIETISGDFKSWKENLAKKDSLIGIILGARGTGKSAIGIKMLENLHSKTGKKCYAIGFDEKEMPSWIDVVENVSEIENNAYVLIDEGGVLFSSRRAMSNANKMLSDLILIARHKNLSILFISQNSSNLDVNIIRQADYIIPKPSSLLQKDFERRKIKEMYEEVADNFDKHKDKMGLTYIYSDLFRGFVANPLPSFWNVKISKSFSGKK